MTNVGAVVTNQRGYTYQDCSTTLPRKRYSAVRLSRCRESSTPDSILLLPNVLSIQPSQPGGKVKSQPNCTRQETASIAVQVVVCSLVTPNPFRTQWI